MRIMTPVLAAALLSGGATMTTLRAAAASTIAYPEARMSDHVDLYFGTEVADPYRWMEDVDSPEVKQWADAELALTNGYLAEVPGREALKNRLLKLTDFERFTAPERHGTRLFFRHNSGLQNQAVLFWQEGVDGTPKVLLDPNTLAADGTVALSAASFTKDGRLMAYSTSEAGSDWQTWKVREVATGRDLPDVVRWCKFGAAAWKEDASGFFYSGYEAPAGGGSAEAKSDETKEDLKGVTDAQKIRFHALGTPQTDDVLVYERPDDKELYLHAQVTDDGRYLLLYAIKGHAYELAVRDLRAGPGAKPVVIAKGLDAEYTAAGSDGETLWMLTTEDAPNGKVVAVHLRKPERTSWKLVIPETKDRVDQVSMVDDKLLVASLADAHTQVEMWSRDGKKKKRLALPGIGTAIGFGGRRTDVDTFFQYTNFTDPGSVYRLDLKTGATTLFRQPKLNFDPARFETIQVFYASKDGTRIPMTLSYRKGLKRDGQNPTMLYGYGGFDISLTPTYSSSVMLWMEMGGIFAQANLRGGGEYGETWHQAGTKLHKQNVFDDYIAAAEWLIANRYTSPKRLAIRGGSNGGLLVGAVEQQRPELFGAAVAQVGVMDMLRFDKFTVGFGWKSDYGSPSENEAEFQAIYRYSPLHNVRSGVQYPPTLITTADHDDRVFPAHSFKYAAAMQAEAGRTPGSGPVLIRIESRAGHGGGKPLSKQVEETVDMYAFLARELRMPIVVPE